MLLEKSPLRRIALYNLTVGLLLVIIIIPLLYAINRAVWSATEDSIHSLTLVSKDAVQNAVYRDLHSLKEFRKILLAAQAVTPAQAEIFLQRYLAASAFTQMAVADEHGQGFFSDGTPFSAQANEAVAHFEPDAAISRPYFDAKGVRKIAMRLPLVLDGQERGTLFGSLPLSNYFLSSAMTFFDGQGAIHMLSARSGNYLLSAPAGPGEGTPIDLYSVLAASPKNSPDQVALLRQNMDTGKSGNAIMELMGSPTYLYYTPVGPNGWYMLATVPTEAMSKAANYANLPAALVCIIIPAGLFVMFLLARRRHTLALEIKARHHRDFLLHTLSCSTNNVFLIYNASERRMEYVFDNLERVLGISASACRQNPSELFKHCIFKEDSRLRADFEATAVREECCEECRMLNPISGEMRWITFSLTPKNNANGRIYYVISLSDITEEKTVRRLLRDSLAAAEQASKAKSNFLSAMSHDIRTPMNAIIGMAAIAERHAADPTRVRGCLDKISVASRLLLGIINEVLDMSVIESGKLLLNDAPFNFNDLLKDTLELIRPMQESKRHQLELHANVPHANLIGDAQRIQQILLNLLSNAVKYTQDKGFIKLSISQKIPMDAAVTRIVIVVEDNGFGMTEEFQTRIFDSFVRSDDDRVHRIQGTGLGMPIVRNLVRMMQGNITIESALNKGSRFTVELALCRQPQRPADGESRAEVDDIVLGEDGAAAEISFEGKHILLVEDNALNMEIAVELIGATGAIIDCAENGRQALDLFAASPENFYDLVFMDIQMPVMNGHDATSAIRTLERRDARHVPIIAMSANVFSEDIQAAYDAGMDGHVPKPIDPPLLLETLSQWIGRQRSEE